MNFAELSYFQVHLYAGDAGRAKLDSGCGWQRHSDSQARISRTIKHLSRSTAIALILSSSWLPLASQTAKQQPSAQTQTSSGGTDASAANDPTASIPQVQIKDGYHTSYDGVRGQGNSLLIRPIIPVGSEGIIPSAIYRIVFPIESEPNGRSGLGDIQLDTFFFPGFLSNKGAKLKIGLGPLVTAPTATSRYTGQGQWQVGTSSVVLYAGVNRLLLGIIETNAITVSGVRARPSSNVVTIQPLIVKTFADKLYLRFDPFWDFNVKEHGTATIPLNLGFGRVSKLGGQEFSAYIQPEFLVRRSPYVIDSAPPRFTFRFAVTLLYPKKKS